MILQRIGNKKRIAHLIYTLFPKHTTYIEPFFGAGGMFFQKPKAKYNLLNDIDNEVFNLWQVVINRPQDLFDELAATPVHESILQHLRKNPPQDEILRAVRFLLMSNFTYLGKGETLKIGITSSNAKKYILEGIHVTSAILQDCVFANKDAVSFLKSIPNMRTTQKDSPQPFIYCDPPYINTDDNYNHDGWDIENLEDLILTLHNCNAPFAISEFNNPVVIDLAKQYNLQITHIKNRHNLKSDKRADEILLTNYEISKQATLF